MHSVASILTCFSLLTHLWVGCCAHHAHGDALEGSVATSQTGCEGRAHGASRPHSHRHGDRPDHSSEQGGSCNEPDCTWVVGGKVQLVDDIVSLPHFSASAAILGATYASHSAVAQQRDSHGCSTLPLRTHLLLQVLLI